MATSLPQGGIHLERGEGRPFWLLTDLFTFKAVGDETRAAFTIAEVTADPNLGPPPHVHRHCDECFYVLDGTWEFSLAGKVFAAGAGSFVYLPKGVLHTHRAGGGAPAKALVIQSPSGVEQFIMEAGHAATDTTTLPAAPEPAAFGRIVEIARKHDIDVPPMP